MVQIVNSFKDKAVRALASVNPTKMGELMYEHFEYKRQGGTMSAEQFVRNALTKEGAINQVTGELSAVYTNAVAIPKATPSAKAPNRYNVSDFSDPNLRMLCERNPAKLGGFLVKYREYLKQGGKVDQESFIRSCLIDEGGIDMASSILPAAVAYADEPTQDAPKTPFKSVKCQLLAEQDLGRMTDLMKEWKEQSSNPSSLASQLGQEAYIELHADLQPGELPWPSQVKEAIAQANKQAKQ